MVKGAIAAVALAVASLLTLGLIVWLASSSDRVDVTDLESGDCFELPETDAGRDEVSTIELVSVVDCGQPHVAQAVAVGDLNPDGGLPYPDDAELFALVDGRCAVVQDDPRFGVISVAPTEETWNGRSGRYVCVAVSFGLEPVVGDHAGLDVTGDA